MIVSTDRQEHFLFRARRLHRTGQARLDLEVAAASPPSATLLVRRAEILERATRREEARAAYVRALTRLEELPVHRRGAPAIAELETRARHACARLSP